MDPNEKSGKRTAKSLLYMMAAMVAVLKLVEPRVVMEEAIMLVETAAVHSESLCKEGLSFVKTQRTIDFHDHQNLRHTTQILKP